MEKLTKKKREMILKDNETKCLHHVLKFRFILKKNDTRSHIKISLPTIRITQY